MLIQGSVLSLTGRASDAIEVLISGIAALRKTEATLWLPLSRHVAFPPFSDVSLATQMTAEGQRRR
jgi:hypothetical protein